MNLGKCNRLQRTFQHTLILIKYSYFRFPSYIILSLIICCYRDHENNFYFVLILIPNCFLMNCS